MSKEEILNKVLETLVGKEYGYSSVHKMKEQPEYKLMLPAMDEHAQQVAVAFAEWVEINCIKIQDGWVSKYGQFPTTSDLYQYFIDNVYNK